MLIVLNNIFAIRLGYVSKVRIKNKLPILEGRHVILRYKLNIFRQCLYLKSFLFPIGALPNLTDVLIKFDAMSPGRYLTFVDFDRATSRIFTK